MNTLQRVRRAPEFLNEFKRICSNNTHEAVVNQCFMRIWDIYCGRRFPDLTYLEHTLDGLRLGQSESIWSRPLLCALWYQHSAPAYQDVEQSVTFAREQLPLLGVPQKDIDAAVVHIRGAHNHEPREYDGHLLADANSYASYGVSWNRITEIVVLKAEQNDETYDYIRTVVSNKLMSVMHGKIYFSGMMRERFDVQTRQNIKDTLKNIKYIGKNNPNRRKLK